jgi:hypothetical protein
MKKTLTLTFTIVGIVLTIGAVAAQQPPPTSTTTPPATEKPVDKAAAVLAALKGNGPAVPEPAPVEPSSSLTTVLDRYQRMATAGQQAPTGTTTIPTSDTAPRPVPPIVSNNMPIVPASPTLSGTVPVDTIDVIRTELRALLGRLDALARKGGGL